MPQTTIIYFDIAALVILSITLISLLLRGLTRGAANRVYLVMTTLFTLIVVAAIGSEFYDAIIGQSFVGDIPSRNDYPHMAQNGFLLIFYALQVFISPAYMFLIATVSDTTHRLNNSTFIRVVMFAPMLLAFVFVLTNPIHHLLFYTDSTGFHNEPYAMMMYIESAFYSIVGIYWILRWRSLFSANEFATLIMLYPIMIASMIVQRSVPNLRLEMFIISIAMLLVSAFVIHPETRHNAQVNAASLSSYLEMRTRAFKTEKPLCLVYIEIVNMQRLSELVGKDVLQEIIGQICENLTSTLERDDTIYYLHNGLFCISSRKTNPEHALEIARQTHERGKAKALQRGDRFSATEMRSCVVRVPEDAPDQETLTTFVRRLSHFIPESGVTSFEEISQRDDFKLQMALSDIIRNAIEHKSFEVHYQPIYCVHDGCFHSAEALVRLNDPELGWIPPSLFVPEAEQNGAIVSIGYILLEKVCAFLGSMDFDAAGLDYVEVNLSVDQCVRPELTPELLKLMSTYHVDSSRINLEITETSATFSQQAIEENVRSLSQAGLTFSLDDFGTGYSNTTRMLQLPISLVKLDKSFVDAIDDEATRIVLADTIAMMKSIGKSVLVEGVETQAQVDALCGMGVDYIQGFYYAKPLPESEFIAFLNEHNECAN